MSKHKGHLRVFMGVKKGRTDWVRRGLESGTPATATDDTGASLLELAAANGHGEVVRILLDAGAELDEARYRKAIEAARVSEHDDIVQELEDFTPDEHGLAEWDRGPALAKAANTGDHVALRRLLKLGTDPNNANFNGSQPLLWAANRGSIEIVKLLIDHGANVDKAGGLGTPIQAASMSGKTEVIELLLARGADVNAKDSAGETALERASRLGQAKVIELLLAAAAANANATHANANAKTLEAPGLRAARDTGDRKRHKRAILGAKKGNVDWLRRGLASGTPATTTDEDGRSLLELAVEGGHQELLPILLEAGAELDEASHHKAIELAKAKQDLEAATLLESYSPDEDRLIGKGELRRELAQAASTGNRVTLQRMLKRGVDPNKSSYNGNPAIVVAAHRGDLDVVKLLLDHGAKSGKPGKLGTPIQAATKEGHLAVVELLLEHGADVNARDSSGENALEAARRAGQEGISELLRSKGAKDRPAPLHEQLIYKAVVGGRNADAVRTLLANGATLVEGVLASFCAGAGQLGAEKEMLHLLLDAGADPNETGPDDQTPLHAAMNHGHRDVVACLLERGADPHGYPFDALMVSGMSAPHADAAALIADALLGDEGEQARTQSRLTEQLRLSLEALDEWKVPLLGAPPSDLEVRGDLLADADTAVIQVLASIRELRAYTDTQTLGSAAPPT